MTFKLCKYGCGTQIEMRELPEGWRAFLESGGIHDCPKSPYNLKKNGGQKQQEPTEEEWKNLQEKNDHGNEMIDPNSTVTPFTKTIAQKQKLMLVKILRSLNSESLEQMHYEFGKTHAIKYCTYCPVTIGDTVEERLCVYYEAEV